MVCVGGDTGNVLGIVGRGGNDAIHPHPMVGVGGIAGETCHSRIPSRNRMCATLLAAVGEVAAQIRVIHICPRVQCCHVHVRASSGQFGIDVGQ